MRGGVIVRLIATDNFSRKGKVGNGALGLAIITEYRLTKTGGFSQAHIARNTGAVHPITEVLGQLSRYFIGQAVARIVHGAQQAFDSELRVQPDADASEGIHQRRDRKSVV